MPINYYAFNKTYRERRGQTHISTNDINQFIELISTSGKVYETLLTNPVKLFIDIDGIPKNEPNIIYEFISKFIIFMNKIFNINITKYALTKNEGSINHAGLSYHVYFPEYYVDKIHMLKFILLKFIEYDTSNKFYDYIDGCIYHFNRLFRCPNQYNASIETIDELDKHVIIKGTIKDCVIQYIDESDIINLTPNYSQVKKLKLKNSSFDNEKMRLINDKKKLYAKFKAMRENTKYNIYEECSELIKEMEPDELKAKIIEKLLNFNISSELINLDNNNIDFQKILTKLIWIDKIKEDIIDELKTANINNENKENIQI